MKTDTVSSSDDNGLSAQAIARHKNLLGFDDKDAALLKAHQANVISQIDSLVDRFYQQQMAIPEVAAVIGDDQRLLVLKKTMTQYIRELFGGEYGSAYVARRLEIGKAHENLGVEARFYLAAVYQLEMLLQQTIESGDESQTAPLRSALRKILQFDTQLVMDNFINNLLDKVKVAQRELEDYAEGLEEVVTERTRQLHELSRKDELTELFNLGGMVENLRRELANAARYKESLSFVCFKLVGYHSLVAKKGQAVGDMVLNQIGHDIRTQIREADVPCRAAEDEFCIIMPRTLGAEAEAICRRLIELFKQDNQYNLSFNTGIATTGPDDVAEADALIKQIDDLLHKADEQPGFNIFNA